MFERRYASSSLLPAITSFFSSIIRSIVGITGTKAEFDTACTNDDFAFIDQQNRFTKSTQTIDVLATGNWSAERKEILSAE